MSNDYSDYYTNAFAVDKGYKEQIFEIMCELVDPSIFNYRDGRISLQNQEDGCGDSYSERPLDIEHCIEAGDKGYNELLSFIGSEHELEKLEILDIIARTIRPREVIIYSYNIETIDSTFCESFAINPHGKRLYTPPSVFLKEDKWPGYIEQNWGYIPDNLLDNPPTYVFLLEESNSLEKFFTESQL